MKYVEFKKFTDENGARPIYLFEGEEVYFHQKGEALLKERFLQEPTLDYVAFEGEALKGEKLKNLLDAVNSFPFISQKRVVKVTEFYPTEKEYDGYLKSLFETPPTDSILLIINTAKGKAGTASLAKKPNVTYVDCSRSDEETIRRWVYLTCKKEGVMADGIVCGKVASYCVLDMARVATETQKLLEYCRATGAERLTDEIVDTLVYPDAEYKIYELANALSKKNYSAYTKVLNDLSARGFNENALLSSLANYFKTLYEVSVVSGSEREIAIALGLKEYAVRKNREQASKFKKEELLGWYNAVYDAIARLRSGEWTAPSALKTVTAKLFFEKN